MPVLILNCSLNMFSILEAEKLRLKEREGFTNITWFFKCWYDAAGRGTSKCHFLTRSYYAQCLKRAGGRSNRRGKKVSKARGLLVSKLNLKLPRLEVLTRKMNNHQCLSLITGLVSLNGTGVIRHIFKYTIFQCNSSYILRWNTNTDKCVCM